jgi:histidinol-phosphate aminotransferase
VPERVTPREAILRMQPYAWEPPSARIAEQAGVPEDQVVRFDTNTFPWPGVPLDALSPVPINEYPDTSYTSLTEALAAYTGAQPEQITVGAGADEILDLLAKAYIGLGDRVVQSWPSYAMFRIVSEIAGGSVEDVPATGPSFGLDRRAFIAAARRARFIWLCNPNNPTGELLPVEFVEEIASSTEGIVGVDEAYFEISGVTANQLIDLHPNLVIVRTLSKAFGLAGARVGYAIAGHEISATLRRVRPPGSISTISELLAVRALTDVDAMRQRVKQLIDSRASLRSALQEIGLTVNDSAGNFLLVHPPAGAAAQGLLLQGLVVRTFPATSILAGAMRITVRKPEENAHLIRGLATHLRVRA